MTHNILLVGVGGEGVLVTSVIVARAAALDGYEVRGTQFHGLAQRGGSIPTHVRFGKRGEVHSPFIPRGQADLILGLEPVEAVRACFFADRRRTNFVIDTYSLKPVSVNLGNDTYPSMKKIMGMVSPFSKKTISVDASNICKEKLGNPIFGNVMSIGVALGQGMLPLSKGSLLKAIKNTVPRGFDKNMQAFKWGLEFKA
jgi:indolepyruvate ferredoxin oxidoreductase beta subunit